MDTEQLREMLLDLERSRDRERELRLESEALLAGLSVLALSEDTESMFTQLFEVLQGVFSFEHACIVTQLKGSMLCPMATTCNDGMRLSWEPGALFRRVLSGTPVAVFDISRIPEWQHIHREAGGMVRSALHVPLRGRGAPAMLICTHSQVGFFSQRHVRLAQRFAPLASQGLLNIQLQHTILERNRFFTLSLEMMCIMDFDGRLKQMNQAWIDGLGFTEEVLRQVPLLEQVHPEDRPQFESQLARLQAGEDKVGLECRHLSADQDYRWLYCCITSYAEEMLYYVVAQDIHERKLMECALRDSEERYALAAMGANDGLWDWNLRTDRIYYSPRWISMLGYGEHEITDSIEEWFSRVHPEDRDRCRGAVCAHQNGLTNHFESEHRILHKDGNYRWVLSRGVAVRNVEGIAYRMAGSQSDITDRKFAQGRLEHDALHDALTGLANRTLFKERVHLAMEKARTTGNYRYAVLFMDLDRFKVINDGLGHHVGDLLLKEFASRLLEVVRSSDTVARLGGDEFTVLLVDLKEEGEALLVSERIRAKMKLPFVLGSLEVNSSASVGIVLGKPDYETVDEVLRDADTAMYRAKALGKARHELFDGGPHNSALSRLQLETDLRLGLERGELEAYYQPIVHLASGRMKGMEALARWRHPLRGLVSPAEFIPLAEETGLIVELGRQMLIQSCRQMQQWQEQYGRELDLYIGVNLSARQLAQPSFSGEVAEILSAHGLDASAIQLEITETMLLEKRNRSGETLRELRAQGLRLSIDDFGTGYSSLSYLQSFHVDSLKIDRSFISGLCGEGGNPSIVSAILALASSLGMTVIAEGIETEEQSETLLKLGCLTAQGYLFSKPLNREDINQKVREQLAEKERVQKGTPRVSFCALARPSRSSSSCLKSLSSAPDLRMRRFDQLDDAPRKGRARAPTARKAWRRP